MGNSSSVIVVSIGLMLAACGGANSNVAKTAEPDPWADYKGTYAPGGPEAAIADKRAEKGAEKTTEKSAEKSTTAAAREATPAARKASKATIHGESVSTIGMDAFRDASKAALKSKVVSTEFIVGDTYEQMQVQLEGVAVEVTRPAANPAKDGPAVRAPKVRNSHLAKTEFGFYDSEADVLVVVNARKKTGAEKMLGTILHF